MERQLAGIRDEDIETRFAPPSRVAGHDVDADDADADADADDADSDQADPQDAA